MNPKRKPGKPGPFVGLVGKIHKKNIIEAQLRGEDVRAGEGCMPKKYYPILKAYQK